MKKIRIPYNKLKPYFMRLAKIDNEKWHKIFLLEAEMQRKFGVPELEFLWEDGELIGIGTPSCPQKMALVYYKR